MSGPIPARPTLWSLQYLRAAAATAVVAFHTNWTHTVIGAAGVDLFFIISGFVMAMVTERAMAPGAFLRDRAIRIVPLYWLCTLVMAVTARPAPWRVGLSLLFWPHDDGKGNVWPVIIPGWTLVYEVFFYGLMAGLLLAPRRLRLPGMGVALLALVAAGRVWDPSGPAGRVYTDPILLEFLAGMLLHAAWRRGWVRAGWPGLAAAGLGVVSLLLQFGWASPLLLRVVLWGVPALLIVGGGLAMEAAGLLPRWRWLGRLGDASYALYLTHGFVLHRTDPIMKAWPAPVAVGAAVLACTAVGLAVHWLVERPVQSWLRQRTRRPALVAT